ncbi:MAG: hypothetical protein GY730_01815 [bacterium]|nr:hypothetical protein [bacterium]
MQVFHPRTKFIHGRPDWLALNGTRMPYYIKNVNIKGELPYLISAYMKSEEGDAVPIDRVVLSNANNKKALFLPEGDFIIVITDKSGNIIEESPVSIVI